MFPKSYRRRDSVSLNYGGEIIASNRVNQVIADVIESKKERKFVETVEVAINLKDVDLQNPQKRINAEVALPHGRGKPVRVAVFAQGETAVISKKIVDARNQETITTTNQLIDIVARMASEKKRNQFLARIFQAIRIEVNDEMRALEEMLLDAVDMLNAGGRLVVLSYHSLEDRMVKNLMKKGSFSGKIQKDFFGNPIKKIKEINSKVIVASESEIKKNPRARSAKLRIAKKINDK